MIQLKRWGLAPTNKNRFSRQAGEIIAYETTPEFAYAAGDARLSYSPDYVKGFTRQFLYVRPGAVVVFDRVSAVRPTGISRSLDPLPIHFKNPNRKLTADSSKLQISDTRIPEA